MLDKLYITPRQWLHILRWTLYALLFLLVMMIQTADLGNRTVFGAHLHLIPVVIVCVCLREGPERGGLFALLASLFWCLSGAEMGSLSLAVLTVVSVLASVLCRALLANRFVPCLLAVLATLFIEQSLIFLYHLFFDGIEPLLYLQRSLPCILVSTLAQPPIYFLVKRISTIGDAYESA